ncbi:hypothetical protein SVAN01_09908 [Stagonosporopsis vannaccii]|nr:hypothetical protein SVAN01_09908 [Stagonosporopsis vannaccii]
MMIPGSHLARTGQVYPLARKPVPPQDLPKPQHKAAASPSGIATSPKASRTTQVKDDRVGERGMDARQQLFLQPIEYAVEVPCEYSPDGVMGQQNRWSQAVLIVDDAVQWMKSTLPTSPTEGRHDGRIARMRARALDVAGARCGRLLAWRDGRAMMRSGRTGRARRSEQSGLAVRRPAGRSQPSNGGLRRALREPLQADCVAGLAAEAAGVAGLRRLSKRELCRWPCRRNSAETASSRALAQSRTLLLLLLLAIIAPGERQGRKGARLSTRLIDGRVVTATCIVRRSLLGNLSRSVHVAQGQKHHHVSGSRRAEGRCHGVLCAAAAGGALVPAWLLFMAGARAAAGKGDRRGLRYSPGEGFPPAAYQDDGTQCQKAAGRSADRESECSEETSSQPGPAQHSQKGPPADQL